MINKAITDISLSDLQDLIDNKRLEDKVIEYKQELNINTDGQKKEFLYDVSSFSNTNGGDIIFGIMSKDGLPTEIVGISCKSNEVDPLKQKIDNIIIYGLKPRLPSFTIHIVNINEEKICLVIRLAKSWYAPHAVTFDNTFRFYARNSSGKYPLDVDELRYAFLRGEETKEKLARLISERYTKILDNDGIYKLKGRSIITLHIVPIEAVDNHAKFSIKEQNSISTKLMTLGNGGNHFINAHGVGLLNGYFKDNSGYSMLFTNGLIEYVESGVLSRFGNDERKSIPSTYIEREVIKCVNRGRMVLNEIGLVHPYYVYLSFFNVKDFHLEVNHRFMLFEDTVNIENNIIINPIEIGDYNMSSDKVLQPLFDSLWNAFGHTHCLDYDQNGKFLSEQ